MSSARATTASCRRAVRSAVVSAWLAIGLVAPAPGLPLRVVPNPHLAVRAAREAISPEDALCVTGSVYLAGIARRALREGAPAGPAAVTRRATGGRSPVAGS